jgi:INO80 complex subunit C
MSSVHGVSKLSELKVKRRKGLLDVFGGKGKAARNLKGILAAEHYDMIAPSLPSFANIDAPPSTLPSKKYCDITGLPAKYTDPKTKVRFAGTAAFLFERMLPEHKVEEFLALRSAQTRIK